MVVSRLREGHAVGVASNFTEIRALDPISCL
jgi:hypothetical protein